MRFPTLVEEVLLHERILQRDPVAAADVYRVFMDPILEVLEQEMGCAGDPAYDAVIDALLPYIHAPERYDATKGRLSTYLTRAAKHGAMDRLRSAASQARRDQHFASLVELRAESPKEKLERSVEVGLILTRLEKRLGEGGDREAVRLILVGERSTEALARVLGLSSLPQDELRREVKRHRDRLMKVLERFGKEDSHDES